MPDLALDAPAAEPARGRKKAAAKKIAPAKTLEAQLWDAADKMRGAVPPTDCMHVCLGLVFLRHLSAAFQRKEAELRELMGNEDLRLIASELVKAVRQNAGMDWWHFDQRRKKVRTTIRRILRQYGYPPDLEDAATRMVVQQAEALAA